VSPFGARFPVTHWGGTLQARFKDADEAMLQSAGPFALAGRVMAMRHHGKSCFAVLRDQSGQIQIYARADVLGPAYAAFVDLDVGDFIGVTGELFRTRTAELTVAVKQFEFLTKALRPLPEKWHGLKDVETRYPQTLYRPDRQSPGPRGLRHEEPPHRDPARVLRRAGLPRSGDPDDAADPGGRRGPSRS